VSKTLEILKTHPSPGHIDRNVLARCIDACDECAGTCTACADADLAEEMVAELRRCIRLCLDCADICTATGRVLLRQTGYDAPTSKAQVEACVTVCRTCAEECERHAAMHEHCRLCAESCRTCEEACRAFLDAAK
jgi:hypothetical protein